MYRKECIAMILAGGQGSRLGVLTKRVAKPAVPFGGKYRIIDFALSNCTNSGIDTVGVLTQYQPLALNAYIGIGSPWDLDRKSGGVSILPPFVRANGGEWYKGTANAVYQNIDFIDAHNPDYVLVLSGDHIYKMDYEVMLDFHKANKADVFKFIAACKNTYDLIFADPPYDIPKLPQLPKLIFENNLLNDKGLLIVEHPSTRQMEEHPNFIETRKYGYSSFSFYANPL